RTRNTDFDRVPYAFPFRARRSALDFVLISVHLHPDAGRVAKDRRRHELMATQAWIASQPGPEDDYVVLGDMNFQDCDEIAEAIPSGLHSLNTECAFTNTNVKAPKPFDDVLYREDSTTEI